MSDDDSFVGLDEEQDVDDGGSTFIPEPALNDALQQETQNSNTQEDERMVNDGTAPQSPSRSITSAAIQEEMPPTPLRENTQSVAGTPGPTFGGNTQSIAGTPFGGGDTPVAGTPATTARSVASSRMGRMVPRGLLDAPTQDLPTQSQSTREATVEGIPARAPPGINRLLQPPNGGGGGFSGDSVNDTLSFGSAPGSRAPSIPDDMEDIDEVQVPMEEEQDPEEEPEGDQAVIWGTDVHVPTAAAAFQHFLLNFRKPTSSDSDDDASIDSSSDPLYLAKLRDIYTSDGSALPIDCQDLHFHSPACQRLYRQLIDYPAEIIPLMDLVLKREYAILHPDFEEETSTSNPIQVRPHNLRALSHMRQLDPLKIDTLISLRGMIVRTSPLIPDLKIGAFRCTICHHLIETLIDHGHIAEPTLCPNCNTKRSYRLLHNRCTFANKQMIRLQETPDEIPPGETPIGIVLFGYDDLVESVRPGDRMEITGVLRAMPRRVHPRISKCKSVFKTYLDVIYFQNLGASGQKEGLGKRTDDGGFSEERIREMKALSRMPDVYERLVEALAPSIWELEDVKKGVLCMLFGGRNNDTVPATLNTPTTTTITDDEGELTTAPPVKRAFHKRGDINILLCGDPGTSKSQLLSYVHKLSPRGVYTSGKGSSAVGLTASVVRDPETRELVLESGALVLSDKGICCIDEFDKMSEGTRAILHEAMEQHTVSVAKAGILASLHARTSILASANPIDSRYNPRKTVVENIQLPPTLLSRFDLIYLILDHPNIERDRRLANHLVGLYYETPTVVTPRIPQILLKDYIAYARDTIVPELSDLATQTLISGYLEMRRLGHSQRSGTGTISATPRQLESLIRLSEGLAKMRLSTEVTRNDVHEALRLMKVATQAAATDPRTGRIDMDMMATGRAQVERQSREGLNTALKELFAERRGTRMSVSDIKRQLAEVTNMTNLTQEELSELLRTLDADGFVQYNERSQTLFVRAGGCGVRRKERKAC